MSIGHLLGKGTVKSYERLPSGEKVLAAATDMTEVQLKVQPTATAGLCMKLERLRFRCVLIA